jgi:hypothetical protein
MMKLIFTSLYICCWTLFVYGQAPTSPGGQEVHYSISAKLDDTEHTLDAQMVMKYINHSTDTLTEIYFHLWANAYQNRKSDFAQQQLESGNLDFHFSSTEEKGGFLTLGFRSGEELLRRANTQHTDVEKVLLPHPLGPSDTLVLDVDFQLQIPKSFSRLGRTSESYQLTQWYPKPAVYRKGEWHLMPYLDQGEFFSEWGQFDVTLNAPGDFLVAATGQAPESQREFLLGVAQSRLFYDEYVTENETPKRMDWHFEARQVHDFALFLDRGFRVDHEKALVPDGDSIDVWALYTRKHDELWSKATTYLKRATSFYSSEIGPYPYPQVTAVEGALSAGAGMEYPMITIIGASENAKELDQVITHEVGHNWWYGILASNERTESWIDEGLNSFYEQLYMKKYYSTPTTTLDNYWTDRLTGDAYPIFCHQVHRQHWQAPGVLADEFSDINYYLANYYWPVGTFMHLRDFVGEEKFRVGMQNFYREFSFSHFTGVDLQQFMESEWEMDLNWLFQKGVEEGLAPNYALSSARCIDSVCTISVTNETEVPAPLSLGYFTTDSFVVLDWNPGFTGQREFQLPVIADAEAIVLNGRQNLMESDYSDNHYRMRTSSYTWRNWRAGLLTDFTATHQYQIFFLPTIKYNTYDHLQIGATVHNLTIPGTAFQYYFQPLIQPLSGAFSGAGRFRWSRDLLSRRSSALHLRLGFDFRRFAYDETEDIVHRYNKWSPYLQLDFSGSAENAGRHRLELRLHHIDQSNAGQDRSLGKSYSVGDLFYLAEWDRPLSSSSIEVMGTVLPDHQRWWSKWRYSQKYSTNARISATFFAAWIPNNYKEIPREARLQAGLFSGIYDFRYAGHWLGRSTPPGRGLAGVQSSLREGTLKSPLAQAFELEFLSTVELRIEAPWSWLPLALYTDLGYLSGIQINSQEKIVDPWLFSPGLSLTFFDRSFEVHFPLGFLDSKVLQNNRPLYYDSWSWPIYLSFSFQWSKDAFFESPRSFIGL